MDIYNRISEIKKRKGTHRRNENNAEQLISLGTNTEAGDYFTLEGNEFACSLNGLLLIFFLLFGNLIIWCHTELVKNCVFVHVGKCILVLLGTYT